MISYSHFRAKSIDISLDFRAKSMSFMAFIGFYEISTISQMSEISAVFARYIVEGGKRPLTSSKRPN